MHSYIAIQNSYDTLEIALFINNILQGQLTQDKRHTSKMLIPLLGQLLTAHNVSLQNLAFCAVNCGPGPFSTLRSVIASVNGLHAATNLPLVGIDGLDATFLEFYDHHYAHTAVLLNAFNNEVYYLIAQQDHIVAKGYKKIDLFLADITTHCKNESIYFIGNGVTLHHDLIKNICGNNAIIAQDIPQMCSLTTIARLGLEQFIANPSINTYLMPMHLKKHAVEL